MTVTIELPPDVEAFYVAEALARGVPLERHLTNRLIDQAPAALAITPQERARAFVEWAESHRDTPPLSDEAISRESIYAKRG
jgi:hypothetical protein